MPPSQLKRLKSSLREQGITGPQKSKKQKKSAHKDQSTNDRISRNAALQQIRDSFNPFELQAPARPAKFESVSYKAANAAGVRYKDVLRRPGVSKSVGEEMRRRQLLPELQRKNKVGELVDRRIGEGDPGMTPEERAAQRFAREKGGRKGRASLFDLEGSDEDEMKEGLTHLGKSLDLADEADFEDAGSGDDDTGSDDGLLRRKRPRPDDDDEADRRIDEGIAEEPERKRTKKEVMQEVIAKSKLLKYERQKAKEDDDDIREELDKGMGEMLALLQGKKALTQPTKPEDPLLNGDGPVMNPDRQRLLDGMDREKVDREYDVRMRQLAQDTRAKPSERTKTEEEKLAQEAERLKILELKRLKRMRGDEVSDDGDQDERDVTKVNGADGDVTNSFEGNGDDDEAAEFGFTNSAVQPKEKEDRVVLDDEDDFAVDEDLIASDSEVDLSDESEESEHTDAEASAAVDAEPEEEDEFIKDILGDPTNPNAIALGDDKPVHVNGLAYTYPCPRNHTDLLDTIKDTAPEQIPTVVQRIRALHHPSLSASNKEAMADFSSALVDHVAYMAVQKQPLPIIEQLIRHLHSLSRTYPERIAETFRQHLSSFHKRGEPTAGDLVVLTAIGSIYPTSDHFHQVVTPAVTLMARWLGLAMPDSEKTATVGAFFLALCLHYQRLSKRYIPEGIRFTFRAIALKPALSEPQLTPHIENLTAMAELWKDTSAFHSIFSSVAPRLQNLGYQREARGLKILLQNSTFRLRPLELHHHRPKAIRTNIPKFEQGFDPDKHYDPDQERSEARKLQKEFKREKKGAVRELRKDANFMAREQLREKRVRDEEYERKQRRLIAEIQGEEGAEAKNYEREKRRRKSAR